MKWSFLVLVLTGLVLSSCYASGSEGLVDLEQLGTNSYSVPGTTVCVGDLGSSHSFDKDSHGLTLLQPSTGPTVLGSWEFEDAIAQDSSPNVNHLSAVPPAGPGVVRGSSGRFDGVQAYYIKHIPAYATAEFSLTAWVFLLEDIHDAFRVLFEKDDGKAFSLRVWPDTRTFRVTVGGKSVDSRARLPLRRWTHIALTLSTSTAQLYINGVPDVSFPVVNSPWLQSTAPVGVATSPSHKLLGVNALIDSITFYSEALPSGAVRAQGAVAFWGVPGGADVAWFACENCNRATAISVCEKAQGGIRPPSHLCTARELASSVMLMMRSLGWADLRASAIFDYENSENYAAATLGVGLCCTNN